ncbi:MAG TPA: hypothetical protein VFO38_02980 [Candidatus Saccharimonadales bacterium]|nr:hypothetical protein [Candidatus Saccharimonadales bacterium]
MSQQCDANLVITTGDFNINHCARQFELSLVPFTTPRTFRHAKCYFEVINYVVGPDFIAAGPKKELQHSIPSTTFSNGKHNNYATQDMGESNL